MKTCDFMSVDSFLKEISCGVNVVYCCTSWSIACRSQYREMARIADRFETQAKVLQVDIARLPGLGEYLAIQSVPTTVIFMDGMETTRLIGCQSAEKLGAAIAALQPSGNVSNWYRGDESMSLVTIVR